MVDRREQRRLETRQRLLDAAKQVFSQIGYQEASILDLTEAADVSKRTFYLHFTDKEAIIEELALGNRLEFREFGVFDIVHKKPRIARNPRTGETVHVPAKRMVHFKVGRLMKKRVLGEIDAEGNEIAKPGGVTPPPSM